MAGFWRRLRQALRARWHNRRRRRDDPAAGARHLVARIERLVHEAKTAAAQAAAQGSRLERSRQEQLSQAEEWARRAAAGLTAGREDLAAEAVKRELSLRQTAEALAPTIVALQARSSGLYSQVQDLSVRLDEARLRARELSHRAASLAAQRRVDAIRQTLDDPWRAGDFDRLNRELDEWEAKVEWDETMERDPLQEQVRRVEQNLPEIQKRLTELRQAQAETKPE
jgi:phage shock protein A